MALEGSKSGGLGLLVGMGSPATAEEPLMDDDELMDEPGSAEADEAAAVAAGDVREALNSNDDSALATALRRFIRIAG